MEEIKFFNKWGTKDVKISDVTLAKHISLKPRIIPHTFGRETRKRFQKAELNIVERLVNKLMRSGQGKRKMSGKYIRGRGGCGKKFQVIRMIEAAFELIEAETKQNPIQVLVKAVENAAPREDTTRIKRGGVAYTVSVDISPMRRIDDAIKNIALAAFAQSFNSKTAAESALAKEIILASKDDSASFSIKRRDEVERIAVASR